MFLDILDEHNVDISNIIYLNFIYDEKKLIVIVQCFDNPTDKIFFQIGYIILSDEYIMKNNLTKDIYHVSIDTISENYNVFYHESIFGDTDYIESAELLYETEDEYVFKYYRRIDFTHCISINKSDIINLTKDYTKQNFKLIEKL